MEITDLRIGNLVEWCGVQSTVSKIDSSVEEFNSIDIIGYIDIPIEEVEPIPLTEEWLFRFSFNKPIDCEGYFKDGITYYNRFMSESQKRPIEFVHQLQNLYFALTGEELTIKTEVSNG